MIYPIRAYGDPILRKECEKIEAFDDELTKLVEDMFNTMDASDGVGLAAPQIGKALRLFVIDSTLFKEEDNSGVRQVFINPIITNEEGKEWSFEEGCLSIPDIREDVSRRPKLSITYKTMENKEVTQTFEGMSARVIQHEFDHIEGVLFVDHISAFKRQLLKGKLANITKGKVNVRYRMKFPKRR